MTIAPQTHAAPQRCFLAAPQTLRRWRHRSPIRRQSDQRRKPHQRRVIARVFHGSRQTHATQPHPRTLSRRPAIDHRCAGLRGRWLMRHQFAAKQNPFLRVPVRMALKAIPLRTKRRDFYRTPKPIVSHREPCGSSLKIESSDKVTFRPVKSVISRSGILHWARVNTPPAVLVAFLNRLLTCPSKYCRN